MSQPTKSIWLRALDLPLILAAACTGVFYTIVSRPAMHDSVLARYTTEHAVEYVIVALFIWGIIDIVFKTLSFPREVAATRQTWIPPRTGRVPAAEATELLQQVQGRPGWLLKSRLGQRLVDALSFVSENGTADDFPEHLRYLADRDYNQSHAKYTLIRFVIAITPILGFFGTVVHFGTALGGFSLSAIDEKLPTLVSEMGTAFNTTTVALGAAVTMTFALFLCERVERNLLDTVDRLVEAELVNRFETRDPNIVPFLAGIQSANQEALKAINASLQKQVAVWSQSLDTLFKRFDDRQKLEVAAWREALDESRKRHEAYDANREERLGKVLTLVDGRQEKHMAQIQAALERVLGFRESVNELVKSLNNVARGEGKLVELQATLTTNLRVLHETRQIDSALHGLTAAIHLLTARNPKVGLHDDGAAA